MRNNYYLKIMILLGACLFDGVVLAQKTARSSAKDRVEKKTSNRAPREGQSIVVPCKNCGECPCKEEICALGFKIEKEIETCCAEILDNFCGTVHHIRQNDIPLTISQPGRYCLVEDVTTTSTAITITNTAGVLIDFNNHSIILDDQEATALSIETAQDVILFGGYIRVNSMGNFGVFIQNSSRVDVHNITFDRPFYGLRALNSFSIVVHDCSFVANLIGLQFGRDAVFAAGTQVVFTSCGECIVRSCIITDFTESGVQMFQVANSYLQDLVMRGTTEVAEAVVVKKSLQVGITDVKIEGAGVQGIFVESTQSGLINNCFINMDQPDAFGISIESGIRIFFDDGLGRVRYAAIENFVVADNIITGSFDTGIHIRGMRQSVLQNNQVLGDGLIGIELDHCFYTRVEGCTSNLLLGDSGIYIRNSSVLTLENCVSTIAAPSDFGNALELLNVLGIEIKDSLFGLNVPETNTPGGDAIFMRGGVKSCLIQNCTFVSFPEVAILAIDSPEYGPNYEIVVDNCVIQKTLEDGIRFESVRASTIKNCEISYADFNGISLINCNTITVLNNTLNNNGEIGLEMDSTTTFCNVRDNTFTGNVTKGMVNSGGASNAIYHNFANGNGASSADNYSGVAFVVAPALGLGVLENISQ